jgi:hypothetical protein
MIDFYIEEHKKTYPDQAVPEEATVKRQSVVEEFRRLQEETKPLLESTAGKNDRILNEFNGQWIEFN